MKNCLQCGKCIEIVNKSSKYKKFCNHSCSALFSNSKRIVDPEWHAHLKKPTRCVECKEIFLDSVTKRKYCSKDCKKKASSAKISKRVERPSSKSFLANPPFQNLKMYITTSTDGRKKAFLYSLNSKELIYSMSYARYLMCVHLGRILGKEEHVDHVNNNPLDDRVENLQILTQKENTQKFNKEIRKGRNMVEMLCPCGSLFVRERRRTHLTNSRKCLEFANSAHLMVGQDEMREIAKHGIRFLVYDSESGSELNLFVVRHIQECKNRNLHNDLLDNYDYLAFDEL